MGKVSLLPSLTLCRPTRTKWGKGEPRVWVPWSTRSSWSPRYELMMLISVAAHFALRKSS